MRSRLDCFIYSVAIVTIIAVRERIIISQDIFIGRGTLENVDRAQARRVPDNGPKEVLIFEREVRKKQALKGACGELKHVAVRSK